MLTDDLLKGDETLRSYLDLIERAADGVVALEDGEPTEEHTYWHGFPARTAMGLWWHQASPE